MWQAPNYSDWLDVFENSLVQSTIILKGIYGILWSSIKQILMLLNREGPSTLDSISGLGFLL